MDKSTQSVLLAVLGAAMGWGQTTPPLAPPAPPEAAAKPQSETAIKDEPALFKSRVNLVQVPVVVRDRQGKAIGTLKKEDFQLFDKGKPQYIARFSMEKAGGKPKPLESAPEDKNKSPDTPPSDTPDRFIAYLFDDIHSQFAELAQTRDAVRRQIDGGLRTTDRVAIYTTSGQTVQDFTDDRDELHRTLAALRPRPVTGQGSRRCPNMTYYMADQMINKNDRTVREAVIVDTLACNNMKDPDDRPQAIPIAEAAARTELSLGDHETRLAMGLIRELVRRMAAMPGQRTIILISSGFLTLPEHATEKSEIMDRAIKANVLINSLDARGLYTYTSDISRPTANMFSERIIQQMDRESKSANADVMAELAAGTGATFIQNNNDFDDGLRRLAAAPEYYYLLAFSPQNLRMDGSFHALKVSVLKTIRDVAVNARKGYYAPTHTEDAKETARRELEEALFSRDEMTDIPVEFATQFFKPTADTAKLSVLIRLDVRKLRFRKEEDRNKDELTLVCGIFDRNGVYVTGLQKLIEMRLRDETLEKRLDNGITIRNTVDIKPGQYSIRIVVRDAEGALMSARNGTVDIPY